MLHLATIRLHYEMGFQSVVDLVEQLENQIEDEDLTLLNFSSLHFDHLQRIVLSQQNENKCLSQTLKNKSKELVKTYQISHRAQVKLKRNLSKAQLLNEQLQTKIRELEKAMEADKLASPKLDSHNSNLPPSLDFNRDHNMYRSFLIRKKWSLRFMKDFSIPFNNNGSERNFRKKFTNVKTTLEDRGLFPHDRRRESKIDICSQPLNRF